MAEKQCPSADYKGLLLCLSMGASSRAPSLPMPSPDHQRHTLGERPNPELHELDAAGLKISKGTTGHMPSFPERGLGVTPPTHLGKGASVPGTDSAVCRAH